jgi:hypothetical protein
MKTLLLTTLAVTVAGLSLAQSVPQRFDVPFAFHVGGTQLPAGEYSVQGQGHSNSGAVLVSAIGHSGGGAFVLCNRVGKTSGPTPSTATLVFHKYGDSEYFLSQAWSGNWSNGLAVLNSRAERKYVNGQHTAHLKPVNVSVVASLN